MLGIFVDPSLQVVGLRPGGPAAVAGVQIGDFVNLSSRDELIFLVLKHREGDAVELPIERNGHTMKFLVILEAAPAQTFVTAERRKVIAKVRAGQQQGQIDAIKGLLGGAGRGILQRKVTEIFPHADEDKVGMLNLRQTRQLVHSVVQELQLPLEVFAEEIDSSFFAAPLTNGRLPRELSLSFVDAYLVSIMQP